jgi:hypothetical protein
MHASIVCLFTDAVPVHDAERVALLVVHPLGGGPVVGQGDGACSCVLGGESLEESDALDHS